MDSNGIESKTKPLISSMKHDKEELEKMFAKDEDDDDSKSLLTPSNGEISQVVSKTKRKVQWNDTNGGNKLAEVLVFQPSDVSDSDDDDDSDTCFCTIM